MSMNDWLPDEPGGHFCGLDRAVPAQRFVAPYRRKSLWRKARDFVAIFAVMLREAWRGPPR